MDSNVKEQLRADLEKLIELYTISINACCEETLKDLLYGTLNVCKTNRGLCNCMVKNNLDEYGVISEEIDSYITNSTEDGPYICAIPDWYSDYEKIKECLQIRLNFLLSLKTKYFEQ